LVARFEQVFEIKDGFFADDGDNPLVGRCLRKPGERLAGLETHANARFAAGIDDLLEARVVAFFGDTDVVETAQTRAQRLFHGVQPVENVHLFSVPLQ
jgi:hypothetical protein